MDSKEYNTDQYSKSSFAIMNNDFFTKKLLEQSLDTTFQTQFLQDSGQLRIASPFILAIYEAAQQTNTKLVISPVSEPLDYPDYTKYRAIVKL